MEDKTNVMRLLDSRKVKYTAYGYEPKEDYSGEDIAKLLGKSPQRVFKTLVTTGKSGLHYVFVIPVVSELDLKKAAKSVGEKSIEMLKAKELLPLTGYIHGGCSPIGMKKPFKTVIDSSAEKFESIIFSAGRRGRQVETSLEELRKVIRFEIAELT